MTRKSAAFLFGTMLLLIVLGVIMQVSIGPHIKHAGVTDPYYDAKNQAIFVGIGLLGLLFTAWFDYRRYAQWAKVLYVLALLSLIACFLPVIGLRINGASRWVKLGLAFQPSEFAKVVGVIVVATWCTKYPELRKTFLYGFLLPMVIVGGLIAAVVVEVDLGNAMLLTCASLSVLYAAGTRLRYLGILVILVVGSLTMAIMFLPALRERMDRITAFLHLDDPKYRAGDGMQQWLGLRAYWSGGPTGLGLGNSHEKLMGSLPYANSDMISSVVGEELGGWFCIFLIGCYVTMTVSGFFIAIHAPDRFGKLLGFGLVCLLALQTVVHFGVTTALLPNKGMPLPFVSAGGTNLITLLCAMGILLNLHRQSARMVNTDAVLGRAKFTPAV
jgi:cell division protein FtsW